MTRDEVAAVIREGVIAGSSSYSAFQDSEHIAEAVLAALASAGLVIGTDAMPDMGEIQRAGACYAIQNGRGRLGEIGLALVRVVANE